MPRDDDHFYRFLETRFRPVDEKLVFVIMPFARALESRYTRLIKPALESEGWVVRRADEIYGTSELMGNIIQSLQEARLVVADLSGRNPNVLYELGLANGFGKPVLLMASTEEDIPTDLRHLTYFILDESDRTGASQMLLRNVREMTLRPSQYAPMTQVQRLMAYSDALGIEDILPANEKFAFDLMLSARSTLDIVFMSARTLSSIHARNFATELTEQFRRLPTRVVLVHPRNEYSSSYYDMVDGLGIGSCAAQSEIGYIRLKSMGVEPRFHMDLLPWGGVLADGSRAAIQFIYPAEWQTYFIIMKRREGGLLNAFQTKFDQVYSKAVERDW